MLQVNSLLAVFVTATLSVFLIPFGVWILLRPLSYLILLLLVASLFGTLVILCNLIFGWLLDVYFPPVAQPIRRRHLNFSTPAAWQAALTRDQWSHTPPRSLPLLISRLPILSNALNEILIFIVRDFVLKWYTEISSSPAFPTAVSSVLHNSAQNIISRLGNLEGPDIIVYKLLPLLTRHVELFRDSESVVRGVSVERHLTRSEELDILLASRYAGTGKLHPAIANLSVISTRQSEEEYLRSLVERILVHVLPEQEIRSRAVLIVVREIVACAVMAPLMEMLADPDFWNKMIDQHAGAAIQEQRMVTKIRHVLERGSARRQEQPEGQTITLSTNAKLFDSFLQSIGKTNSLLDARRMKNDILGEIRRTRSTLANHEHTEWINGVRTENIVAYLDRLYTAKRLVEKRIAVLGGTEESSDGQILYDGAHQLKLQDILISPSSISYLMEFMDRRGRAQLVQFWLTVESFKDPLESVEDDDNDDASFVQPQEPSSETKSHPSTDDLTMLCQLYFSQETLPPVLSVISLRHVDSIRTFLAEKIPSVQTIRKAKRAVLLAQRQVEGEMESDFVEFKKSDLWFAAAKNAHHPVNPNELSSVPQERTSSEFSSGHASSLAQDDTDSIGEQSVGEVGKPSSASVHRGATTSNLSLLMDTEQNPALGRSPLFGDAEEIEQTQQMLDIQAALTDIIGESHDESPQRDFNKSSQQVSGSRRQESEEDLGALGEFNTSNTRVEEEKPLDLLESKQMIEQLGRRIDRIRSERNMLDVLMQKAELSGDKRKLQLFGKSHIAMDRDLRELTFQKSQFEQQLLESEFTLGRVKVSIVDSSTEGEEARPVVRYLIEVKQLALDDAQVSGWVVARRYNEFLAMHTRLKEKYVAVRSLEFPGKRLVTSMSTAFLEARKVSLEKYLQSLVVLPMVSQSQELLEFLSPDSPMQVHPSSSSSSSGRAASMSGPNLVRSVYKSVSDSIDDMLFGPSMLEVMIQRLTAQAAGIVGIVGTSVHDEDLVARAFKASAEANSINPEDSLLKLSGRLEPYGPEGGPSSFSTPICNLILSVFELDQQNNWFRRHATVIILQQVLGSTIERKFRETFKGLTEETSVLVVVKTLKDALWPNGVLQTERESRTAAERTRTRHSANQKLSTLLPDMVSSMLGRSNARRGARRLFSVVQNRRLNQHILYTLLDTIVAEMYPEIQGVSGVESGHQPRT